MVKKDDDEEYNNEKQLKKSHSVISQKKREKLIEFVIKENMTIYRAAKRLKICHPTAKFIVKNYRQMHNIVKSTITNKAKSQKSSGKSLPQIQKQEEKQQLVSSVLNIQASFPYYTFDQAFYGTNLWSLYGNNCPFQQFYIS